MSGSSPTQVISDRNLLFGILALQMDFISRDALIGAMQAWFLNKANTLGRILLEQGHLDEDAHDLLEALVAKHLERHGHDPIKSLASLSTLSSVPQELQQVADADLQASLAHVNRSLPTLGEPESSEDLSAGTPTSGGPRFRIIRPHAKGGLGEVFVAYDKELHREVALKEIQPQYAHDLVSRSRFLLEAEITGGLEHPGIVPVYGLGQNDDGRPYYAMRFIKGESLREAIDRFHQADQPGRAAGERSLALRQLLGRFLVVCQALAYAHARGVLHRDLKPANIMLGQYGETLVVDWGLAKPVGRPEGMAATEEVTLNPTAVSGSAPTQLGQVIGTPSYMSPEQAAGGLDQLGPASDVYSLGATLYCLLTGQKPVGGEEVWQILDRVRNGEFPPPRQVKRTIPAALEAICLKAMALRPEDRYPSPRALADDLEHWLADEPVAAYREPWAARLGRWSRRHRPLVTGAAGLLVAAVAGLILGMVAVQAEQVRTAHERDLAETNLKLADENFRLARKAVDDCYSLAKDHPLLKPDNMRQVRKLLLEKALPFYQNFRAQRQDDRQLLEESADNSFRVAYITLEIGQEREAEEAWRQAAGLWEQLCANHPEVDRYQSDLAHTYSNLGVLKQKIGDRAGAITFHKQAQVIREKLTVGQPEGSPSWGDLAMTYHNLGWLHQEAGDGAAAVKSYEQARPLEEKLVALHPELTRYQSVLAQTYLNLGIVRQEAGDRPGAIKFYELARAVREKLAAQHPDTTGYQSDLATTYNYLAWVHHENDDRTAAVKFYEQARGIREKLAQGHPEVTSYRSNLAWTYHGLGFVHQATGDRLAAIKFHEQARAIREKLAEDHPSVTSYQSELADTYNNLGVLRQETGDLVAAIKFHEQARAIREKLTAGNPDILSFQSDLAWTYHHLGLLKKDSGDTAAALKFHEQARTIREKLAEVRRKGPNDRPNK